ncbi:hypothetical protein MPSI1_000631a [Malassezia psittaci]|uniref:Uncharacterized protein n=1 Tax=Malassezia psittaci TaxID=1821823 RepID=A0AAF0FBN3_9BASI|nr:hypothetical protein MPSI1_000631a [Malassezia psittaci]
MNSEFNTINNGNAGTPIKPINTAQENPETPVNHEGYPACPVGWGQTCTIA